MPKKPVVMAGSLVVLLALTGMSEADQLELPVPMSTVYPGDAVDAIALNKRLYDVPGNIAGRFVLNEGQLRGYFAKRILLAGKPIPLAYLKVRETVLQGGRIKAVYEVDGVTITALLVPLQSGHAGDVIDARNSETGIIVKAQIAADGTLRVVDP